MEVSRYERHLDLLDSSTSFKLPRKVFNQLKVDFKHLHSSIPGKVYDILHTEYVSNLYQKEVHLLCRQRKIKVAYFDSPNFVEVKLPATSAETLMYKFMADKNELTIDVYLSMLVAIFLKHVNKKRHFGNIKRKKRLRRR